MEYTAYFYFDKKGQVYDDLFKKMDAIISRKRGSILDNIPNGFRVSSIRLNEVLPEVEQWSKANPDVSCWLQFQEAKNGLGLVYGEIADTVVREYANGELVYSMDGSIEHKKALEPEETTIEDDRLHICKSDGKKGVYIIDGIIGIDTRIQKEPYYVFSPVVIPSNNRTKALPTGGLFPLAPLVALCYN